MITNTANRLGLPTFQAHKQPIKKVTNQAALFDAHPIKSDSMIRFSGDNTRTQNAAVSNAMQEAKAKGKSFSGIKSFMNKAITKLGAKVVVQWVSDNATHFFHLFKEHAEHLWDWVMENFHHFIDAICNVM